MANDLQTAHEPSITGLVGGIINDAQELLKQQLALFKQEVKDDVRKTKEAVTSLAIGVSVLAIGGIFLCFMLVYLLNWIFPSLPLWCCYGIIGLIFAVVGGALMYAGKKRFESFNPLPDQSVGALKENVQWVMNPKK